MELLFNFSRIEIQKKSKLFNHLLNKYLVLAFHVPDTDGYSNKTDKSWPPIPATVRYMTLSAIEKNTEGEMQLGL